MPRFAANISYLFTELPFLDRIGQAARAGFRAVEYHYPYATPPEAFREELKRHGVKLLGINTAVQRLDAQDAGVGAIPGQEAEAESRLHEAYDYARRAGGSAIHLKCGSHDSADVRAHNVFVSHLREAGDMAADSGITILIEPLNHRDNPGYFLDSVEQAARVVKDVARPNVKLMFDIYHVQILDGDILKRLEALLPLIGHIQIAAVPSRAEPDEGELNYRAIFRAIDALGYGGWIGAEYRPRETTEAGLGWLDWPEAAPRNFDETARMENQA